MIRRVLPLTALLLCACPPKHAYPDGSDIEGQLEREVIALQQTVRSLEYAVEICGEDGQPDSIYTDLYQVFKGTEVGVDRRGLITIVSIPGDHLFSGGTDLRYEAKMSLDLIATALNLHPEHTVRLEGHTDDAAPSGDLRRLYANNWDLSYARAEAVMHALVADFGVAEHRFIVSARGPYDPIATNDTEAGRAKNRRVVVYIRPSKRRY